jgi:hypothetical protein
LLWTKGLLKIVLSAGILTKEERLPFKKITALNFLKDSLLLLLKAC